QLGHHDVEIATLLDVHDTVVSGYR
ncbi:MAG: hypothetical protein RIT28_3413, partial [Pseudomonadota bacterium]